MRKLIMLAAALAIAACSDTQQTTSPVNQRSANSAGDVSSSNRSLVAQGKPAPSPVGFTKTTVIYAPALSVAAGAFNVQDAICPAGTVMVSGGHELGLTYGGTAPLVWRSRPHLTFGTDSDGWSIAVDNTQQGAKDIYIQAWAVCAS